MRVLSVETNLTNLQQKGISKLLGLDYKILYRKGAENVVADALFRRPKAPESQSYSMGSIVVPTWLSALISRTPKHLF